MEIRNSLHYRWVCLGLLLSLLVSRPLSGIVSAMCGLTLAKVGVERLEQFRMRQKLSAEDQLEFRQIFKRIQLHPKEKLGSWDREWLRSKGLEADMLRFQRMLNLFGRGLSFFLIAGGGVCLTDLSASFVGETQKSNADCEADTPGDEEVDLLLHSPMGHMTLRIGNQYYDFTGSGMRKIYTQAEFLTACDDRRWRDSTRIRLKLGSEKRAQILKEFTENQHQGYTYTLVSHCVSQMNGTLEEQCGLTVPAGIDHVPSMSKTWYKLRAAMNDGLVQKILYCSDRNFLSAKADEVKSNLLFSILGSIMIDDLAIIEKIQQSGRAGK